MKTTQQATGVGPDAIVSAIVAKLLSSRNGLPKAANGQPKAPSDAGAAQILKDMGQGRSREIARLVRVFECNQDDGVPVDVVEAPLLMMIAYLRTRARVRTDRPIPVLLRLETKAQAALDLAELKLAESPTSIAALEEVLQEAEAYEAPLRELEETCRERLAVARTVPAPVSTVRRRGHMQLMHS